MRKLMFMLVTIAFSALLLAGCSTNSSEDGNKGGKHLNLALFWIGETMDPANNWDAWTVTRLAAGETLVTVTDKMEFEGQIADHWKNIDDTTWEFHIRQGVKFHDGTPVTPELVKASLERTLSVNQRSAKSAKIKSITVDGENLRIETVEPYASFLPAITDPSFVIINTTADMSKVASTPVMTGPYQIVKFDKSEGIELKQFAEYWGGKPGLDTISVKSIKDSSARSMALQSGELDMIHRVDDANRQLFENNSFKIYDTVGIRTNSFTFNVEGLLQDPNLRQAIVYGLDYEKLAKAFGNSAVPAGAPFPPTANYGYNEAPKQVHDVAKAKAALAAAGYVTKNAEGYLEKDGQPLVINMSIWDNYVPYYEAVQAQLKELGIKVDIKKIPNPNDTGDTNVVFDMLETTWLTVATNDSYWYIEKAFRTGSDTNRGHYSNPEVDALIAELAQTFDTEKRIELTKKIQDIILKDNAYVFTVFPINTVVASTKVKNVPAFPIEYYLLTKDVTIEQ